MKVQTEPKTGLRWCVLSVAEEKKLADACSIAQGVALVESHDETGAAAQRASDAVSTFIASRVPAEDTPAK